MQEVEDLRLDRHVQRAHRLVEDDELRADGERPGDADPLPLATAELVREAIEHVRRQADEVEKLGDSQRLAPAAVNALDTLADDPADGVTRVERRVGVLEDDLHPAPQPPQLPPGEGESVAPLEEDLTARRRDEAGEQPRDC